MAELLNRWKLSFGSESYFREIQEHNKKLLSSPLLRWINIY